MNPVRLVLSSVSFPYAIAIVYVVDISLPRHALQFSPPHFSLRARVIVSLISPNCGKRSCSWGFCFLRQCTNCYEYIQMKRKRKVAHTSKLCSRPTSRAMIPLCFLMRYQGSSCTFCHSVEWLLIGNTLFFILVQSTYTWIKTLTLCVILLHF